MSTTRTLHGGSSLDPVELDEVFTTPGSPLYEETRAPEPIVPEIEDESEREQPINTVDMQRIRRMLKNDSVGADALLDALHRNTKTASSALEVLNPATASEAQLRVALCTFTERKNTYNFIKGLVERE